MTATFTHAVPVLPALNIQDTIRFFEQHLGFTARHQEDEYGIVRRDAVEIHFWRCADRRIAENTSCRIHVQGVDELYREVVGQGIVHPNAALETKPWGVREFAIVDASGNLVWFVE
jgi:catechol 2,3-dioxygenase-like lactoylglutathione lyase family enzyme